MIQVAEIEATAAAAVADLNADRRVITVQRPCAAAPTATVVITAGIAPLTLVHPGAFALWIADVIEVETKIVAAIRAATRAKIKIGTKTEIAAVIRAVTRARIGTKTKIATKTKIVVVIGAAIEIAIKIA
jgi:hypothetical protein